MHLQKLLLRASFDAAAIDFPRRVAELQQLRRDGSKAEEQRTPAWFAMRENRLTASNFSNAAGYASPFRQSCPTFAPRKHRLNRDIQIQCKILLLLSGPRRSCLKQQ